MIENNDVVTNDLFFSTVRLVLLCAGNFVTRIAVGACFMAASVMINESVTPDVIGSANGLSIAMGNVAKYVYIKNRYIHLVTVCM